jgi:hypothetical protein
MPPQHGLPLPAPRRLLERIMARENRPLDTARKVANRVAGNCRHFTVLTVVNGIFEDRWVCEYWHAGQQRWIFVDAQIDDRQRHLFPIDFDVIDVPATV